jgi:hypothetical protein
LNLPLSIRRHGAELANQRKIETMTKQEIEAKLADIEQSVTELYKALGMPSWQMRKRQARDNAELLAHTSNMASGGRSR